jgi:hypothetical protein
MDYFLIITLVILVFLKESYGNNNKNTATKKPWKVLDSKRSKITWDAIQNNVPLGLMLSKRATPHKSWYAKKIIGEQATNINIVVRKKLPMNTNRDNDIQESRSMTNKNDATKTGFSKSKKHFPKCKCSRKSLSCSGRAKCPGYVCCKRNLTKLKMKKVIGLLRAALVNLQDPPSKKKLKPPCDMGVCSLPCSNCGCGCCGPCMQMVKVKYHPPKFDFKAMKGQLMCGCGFGNPCGGCMMKTG